MTTVLLFKHHIGLNKWIQFWINFGFYFFEWTNMKIKIQMLPKEIKIRFPFGHRLITSLTNMLTKGEQNLIANFVPFWSPFNQKGFKRRLNFDSLFVASGFFFMGSNIYIRGLRAHPQSPSTHVSRSTHPPQRAGAISLCFQTRHEIKSTAHIFVSLAS